MVNQISLGSTRRSPLKDDMLRSRGGDGSFCPGRVVVSAPTLAARERVDAAGIADMTELAGLACGRYGISPDCSLNLYPLTENWTYRVDAGPAAPVVLRIYRPGGRPPAEILSELAWMNAIGQQSRSLVPDVIPTAGGSQVLELTRNAPLYPCYCVMFSYATGREPAEEELAAWFPELGAITARLHRHARSWTRPSWFQRPRWDVSTTLGDRPHWGPWQKFVTDAEELTQLERLAKVVMARLREFGEGTDRFGLVHAGLRHDTELAAEMRANGYNAETCTIAEPYLSRLS